MSSTPSQKMSWAEIAGRGHPSTSSQNKPTAATKTKGTSPTSPAPVPIYEAARGLFLDSPKIKPTSATKPNGTCSTSSPIAPTYTEKVEGMLCTIIAKSRAREEDKWAYELLSAKLKSMTRGPGGHMVVVFRKELRDGRSWCLVCTVTTTCHVLGLSAIHLVPISPNNNTMFLPSDTHDITYRMENISAKTFKETKSFLRRDNAFAMPESTLEPILGTNGKPIVLDKSSLQDWKAFMEQYDIVQNSEDDGMWLVNRGLANLGLPVGTTHKSMAEAEQARLRRERCRTRNTSNNYTGTTGLGAGNPANNIPRNSVSGATAALGRMSIGGGREDVARSAPPWVVNHTRGGLGQRSSQLRTPPASSTQGNSQRSQGTLSVQQTVPRTGAQQHAQSTPNNSSPEADRSNGRGGRGGYRGRGGQGGSRGGQSGGHGGNRGGTTQYDWGRNW